ncbi:hypothetical protein [Xanthomarina gelatinilytica]|uniref:hypothetical protein n=1 Tax=Xanthomarina gelatinilytica TaxID=1137281 RepID=UPI0029A0041B|nr:hypothetical protein [Putridiphycobacter sp.]
MNYIKQMNAIFAKFYKDSRLNTTHISLYISLFQLGNLNRFPETFYINREEIMKLSKIGSKATYHRCLKQLDHWGYIKYLPSHNPYKGSKIKLLKFDTSSERVQAQAVKQALVPYIKQDKLNEKVINLKKKEVVNFFKIEFQKLLPEKKLQSIAEKFYNHYKATGWLIGGKTPIIDWQAAAQNWMQKALELKSFKHVKTTKNLNHLKTNRNKNYGAPL